jgi:serine/threonine protein kinase
MDRKISFPNTMSPEAVDLIDKLIQPNPLKRLGYGPAEDNMDFAALKAHPFFNNLNFDKIRDGKIAPPVPPQLKALEDEEEDQIKKNESEEFFKEMLDERQKSK